MHKLLAVFILIGDVALGAEEFSFSPADLQKELGQFDSCNGKKINLPQSEVTKGMSFVPQCVIEIPLYGVQLTKPCVGLCVAEKLGYMHENKTYNYEAATKALRATVGSTDPSVLPNDKDLVDKAASIARKCGTSYGPYILKDDCPEAKKFDACLRKAAVEECGLKVES